jgi:hypothetical protein
MSKAVRPDGTPTYAKDENGILLDLSAKDVEAMAKREPGSAAAYLEERRQQIEAKKQADGQKRQDEEWMKNFISKGGVEENAAAALQAKKDADAAEDATRLDREAIEQGRRHIKSRL